MKPFVTSIEDLKENREEIIERIKIEAETEDMAVIARIMKQVVSIVTAPNYESLDYDIYETIERATSDVKGMTGNSSVYAALANATERSTKNQLPSSMR
jgi:hypothetical protein